MGLQRVRCDWTELNCHLVSPKVLSLSTWSADVNICILWTKQLCCYYQNMFICLMLYLLICCLVTQLCPPICDPMDCSTPGFHVLHYLLELAQTHVHWISDAIQPAHPLLSPSPPAFNLSQHQGLFQWVSSSHQVAKGLELQLQHQSFQRIFRTDFL